MSDDQSKTTDIEQTPEPENAQTEHEIVEQPPVEPKKRLKRS